MTCLAHKVETEESNKYALAWPNGVPVTNQPDESDQSGGDYGN